MLGFMEEGEEKAEPYAFVKNERMDRLRMKKQEMALHEGRLVAELCYGH